ncbi:MAG TPA: TRAP transporter small permease subunit [Candidatus Cybelea sp.]|nr:TRAP transporter small permease subunit [Candidatus Cybelea sp.]
MPALGRIADFCDAISDATGRWAAWLVLGVVGLLFAQVPLREFFHGGHIVANDIGQVVHAAVFMLGAAYAFRWDGHVRVDIFHQRMDARMRALVEFAGTALFLLPWLALLGWFGWPIVLNSWVEREAFAETYTPGYFLLKALLAAFVALMGIQALGHAARALAALLALPSNSER